MLNYNQYTAAALKNAIQTATRDMNKEFYKGDLKNKLSMFNALIRNGVSISSIPQKIKKQKVPRAPRVPRPEGAVKYARKKLIGPTIPKEIKAQMVAERKQQNAILKEQKMREKEAAKVAKNLSQNVIKKVLAQSPKLTKTGKPRRTRAEIQIAKAQKELEKNKAKEEKRLQREQLRLQKKQNKVQPLKYGYNPDTQSSVYYL
jgi:hypothetical protein